MTCLVKGWCEEHQVWHAPKMDEAMLSELLTHTWPAGQTLKPGQVFVWTGTPDVTSWEPIANTGSAIAPPPEQPQKRKRAKPEETLTSRIVDEWMRRI